ncbi:hypothetical protein ACFO5R_21410 [Halosolutus amylolyticus]|uniref:Uncharacterized protein n=1 Tax=Halosolutus amylolyticus TaxID=2932267 RepID=A0ABD5PVM9_9EURY|nr:hypothetical protein [Halosolutus amylolyticus]
MSPALWWSGEAIFDDLTGRSRTDGRLYVDVGGREAPDDPALNEAYLRDAKRLVERLRERGYDRDRLRFVVDEDAEHHEAAWAERFPDAARFLLP